MDEVPKELGGNILQSNRADWLRRGKACLEKWMWPLNPRELVGRGTCRSDLTDLTAVEK